MRNRLRVPIQLFDATLCASRIRQDGHTKRNPGAPPSSVDACAEYSVLRASIIDNAPWKVCSFSTASSMASQNGDGNRLRSSSSARSNVSSASPRMMGRDAAETRQRAQRLRLTVGVEQVLQPVSPPCERPPLQAFRAHVLGGHPKSGHIGSPQNRP